MMIDAYKTFIKSPLLENAPGAANEEDAIKMLEKNGWKNQSIYIPPEEFNAWLNKVDFENRFPIFLQECGPPKQSTSNLIRKQFEYFLSYKLSDLNEFSKVIDVAAAQAPFQRLLRDIFGVQESWRQDWNYRTNILNKTLGGNASSLEVDDESFDSLFLHNSWEHFEGESDFEFLKEASRVLKPGGKVFITPLFFGIEGFVTTSPEIWTNKYQATSEPPKFREQIPVFIDNTIEQRYSQRHSAELLLRHFKDLAQLSPKIISIKNAKEFEGFHPFALVIEKL